MKSFSFAVIVLLCFVFSAQAANVYTGCRTPSSTFRHDWYFDPVHGKTQAAGGDGSQAAPWNNLQALIQAEPGYSYPLLTTAPYRQVPVPGQPAVNEQGRSVLRSVTGDLGFPRAEMSESIRDNPNRRLSHAGVAIGDFALDP